MFIRDFKEFIELSKTIGKYHSEENTITIKAGIFDKINLDCKYKNIVVEFVAVDHYYLGSYEDEISFDYHTVKMGNGLISKKYRENFGINGVCKYLSKYMSSVLSFYGINNINIDDYLFMYKASIKNGRGFELLNESNVPH